LLQFNSSFHTYQAANFACEEQPRKTATWKNGTNCCSWDGITCDTVSGRVIGLNLGCESLQGEIYPNSTLFHLVHLKSLNLSHNYFFGSHFHSKFGGFQNLTNLDLSYCTLKGDVPPQISHHSKLTSLHLSRNDELSWKETTLKSLMQNATILRELFLEGTNMSSINPNLLNLIFNQSSSLVSVSLQNTGLRGNWKKNILCLPSIQQLDMSENYFLEGRLPDLSCSTFLRILDLSYCFFKGPIPLSFSNFTYLTSLRLIENNLKGSIPSSLLTLPHLTVLSLRDNFFISGQIPNVFPKSNRFQEINLSGNKIGGALPTSLSNLQYLIKLDLSSNSFSGQIPNVFARLTKLQELILYNNRLEGQIPPSLFSLSQIVVLSKTMQQQTTRRYSRIYFQPCKPNHTLFIIKQLEWCCQFSTLFQTSKIAIAVSFT
jgi:Leucine-rich repeat (LRR) protein